MHCLSVCMYTNTSEGALAVRINILECGQSPSEIKRIQVRSSESKRVQVRLREIK